MSPKDYLLKYRSWQATRLNLLSELSEIEKDEALPSGIAYDKDPVQHSSSSDGMINIVERIRKRQESVYEKISWLDQNMALIRNEINGMPDYRYRRLLYLYYVDASHPNLSEIADQMVFDAEYMKHLHGHALQAFMNQYPEHFTDINGLLPEDASAVSE